MIAEPRDGTLAGTALNNLVCLLADAGVVLPGIDNQIDIQWQPFLEKRGLHGFRVEREGHKVLIEMSELPLKQVRFLNVPSQNPWHFPKFYVAGSSWLWCFSYTSIRRHLGLPEDMAPAGRGMLRTIAEIKASAQAAYDAALLANGIAPSEETRSALKEAEYQVRQAANEADTLELLRMAVPGATCTVERERGWVICLICGAMSDDPRWCERCPRCGTVHKGGAGFEQKLPIGSARWH